MLARLSERGRSGCGVFRRVLDERALKVVSPHRGLLEPRFAGLAKRFGLPPYEYQRKIFDAHGRFIAQVDFAYPEVKLAIEVDGFEDHGTPQAMIANMDRDHRPGVENGWYVIHFAWFHVVKRPKVVADRIKALLVARRRALHVVFSRDIPDS